MSDITEFFGGAPKPTERKKRVEKKPEEKKVDPIEQLLADRGYSLVDKIYGRVGNETVPLVVIARDPFGQIHYICTFPISGRLCGAEFYNILDVARHLRLVHERNLSEMGRVIEYIIKQVREGKLSLDLVKSVLPQDIVYKIERELT